MITRKDLLNRSKSILPKTNLSIRSKIILSFLILLVSMSIVNIFLIVSYTTYLHQYNTLLDTITTVNSINGIVKSVDDELYMIINGSTKVENGKQYTIIQNINDTIRNIKTTNITSKKSIIKLDMIQRTVTTLKENVDDIVHQIKNGGTYDENMKVFDKNRFVSEIINQNIQEFVTFELDNSAKIKSTINKNVNNQIEFNIITLCLLIVFSFICALIISNSISNPIKKLRSGFLSIAEGNLDVEKLKIHTKNEIGDLSYAFNTMVTNLREMTQQASDYSKKQELTNIELRNTLETLRMTQDHLVQSEKLVSLGRLVAGVAHEINTPIGVCITAISHQNVLTQSIKDSYSTNQLTRKNLGNFIDLIDETTSIITNNLDRTAELVSSFKKVAIEQSNEQRSRFYLRKYIETVVISLRPELNKTNVDIDIDCDASLEIISFAGGLSQIITNLVINSTIHAFNTMENGQIHIHIKTNDTKLIFIYKDNGNGITEDNLKKIFDPFFTTNRSNGGSGLGLHVVHNIVTQLFDGIIRCESKVGVGTEFIIEFPLNGSSLELIHERQIQPSSSSI